MGRPDIPVDKAELLSVLLESVLYGFSLIMFGATIWTLVSQRSTDRVNSKLFAVACALLLCSTMHLVIDIIRAMDGFIFRRDSYPGGPAAYFSDTTHWTTVSKDALFSAQTLIGDGVVLYRCYAAWQSKLVIILPLLLWCAVFITGIASPYVASLGKITRFFGLTLSQWVTSFYAFTFTTNLLTTLLLVYRVRYFDKKATNPYGLGLRSSQLQPTLHLIIDAGVIYSLTLLVQLIVFSCKSNFQYVILGMITPIISITFYMVIMRVGLANWTRHNLDPASVSRRLSTRSGPDRRSHMQVHVEIDVGRVQVRPFSSSAIECNGE